MNQNTFSAAAKHPAYDLPGYWPVAGIWMVSPYGDMLRTRSEERARDQSGVKP